MEIDNMVENTLFEKIEEYVFKNTSLTITEPYIWIQLLFLEE